MNITFREATFEDCKMIRNWIKTNEFTRRWYYAGIVPRLSSLQKKMAQKLQKQQTRVNIVLVDDFPIGYIQSYPVDGNGNWTRQVKVAENMVSIDYFIGDIRFIHKGIGPKMISEYIERVIKKEKFAAVLISPDPENRASRKCIEKCGFRYVKTVGIPYNSSKSKEAVYIKEI